MNPTDADESRSEATIVTTALSKVQSVDQRMRLECGVGFSPTADVPSHTPEHFSFWGDAGMEIRNGMFHFSLFQIRREAG